MSERKPLTLEQLREMDGKPVLFVSLKDGRKKWRVVQSIEKLVEVVKVICFTDDGGETVESYGKTWLAYASEPPCLDRSAWEPCGCCKEKRCPTCKYDDCIPIFDRCNSCVDGSGWKPVYKFCPECGRPMTDAAWEMLQKRLEGHK